MIEISFAVLNVSNFNSGCDPDFFNFTNRLAERQDNQEATIPNTGITTVAPDRHETNKQQLLRSLINLDHKPINWAFASGDFPT